jgi:hypothetical protein
MYPLMVDDPLTGDNSLADNYLFFRNSFYRGGENQDAQERAEVQQIYRLKMQACPNQKCALYGKAEKSNIVSNGFRRTKEGTPVRRFLCKECKKSFLQQSKYNLL